MSLHLQLEMLVYIWILIAWLTELPLLLEIGKRKQSMLQHWSLRLELRGCPADTKTIHYLVVQLLEFKSKNHGTQDSHVVPHHGTNWAIPDLVAQIGRDATFYGFYGRGWKLCFSASIYTTTQLTVVRLGDLWHPRDTRVASRCLTAISL
jgi:hypothetical protein